VRAAAPNLWADAAGEAFVYGNVREAAALELVEGFDAAFEFAVGRDPTARERAAGVGRKVRTLPVGNGLVLERPGFNAKNDPNSAVEVVFQLGRRADAEVSAYAQLLASVLDQPFYGKLRTKQQTGYLVACGVAQQEGVLSIRFLVQSPTVDGTEVLRRVDDFLADDLPAALADITPAAFADVAESVAAKRIEPEPQLAVRANRYWGEIATGAFGFTRPQDEAAAIRKATRAGLLDFVARKLLAGGAERRCVAIKVVGGKVNGGGRDAALEREAVGGDERTRGAAMDTWLGIAG